MKKLPIFLCLVIFLPLSCKNKIDKFPELRGEYFGQEPPSEIPQLFAPGIISTGLNEMNICFSPSGEEMYYFVCGPAFQPRITLVSKVSNSVWSEPTELPFFNIERTDFYPFISPDSKKLFFNSARRVGDEEPVGHFHHSIWYADKNEDKWEEPQKINFEGGFDGTGTFPSVALNGNLYFNASIERSISDIYVSKYKNGVYKAPVRLSDSVNSNSRDFHPYIAPDEGYILFDSMREEDSFGRQDIFISFRDENGNWTKAINLGNIVNTENTEIRPFVTFDKKYLFFISSKIQLSELPDSIMTSQKVNELIQQPGNGLQDIYWVEAAFIEELKKTVLN